MEALFALPFLDLLFHAQRVHRAHHEPNTVQMSTLLSIKTGACPEDCAYCPQSVRYDTGLERETLLEVAAVREARRRAKAAGATRFCMGAAYRSPKAKDIAVIAEMIREVRAAGLETCATLGMLTPEQAQRAEGRGPGLLQPQPRHLAGVLRRDHHDAHVPGSSGHAGGRARGGAEGLLRWHRRHGRDRRRDRAQAAADPGESSGASRERADQPARAGAGHAAARRVPASIRLISCARSRSRDC